jgi:hypothetical protein
MYSIFYDSIFIKIIKIDSQNNYSKYSKMFDIKSLPSEVTSLICSFGYPEYKEHMKEICHQIMNYTGTGLLAYNLYLLEEDYHYLYRINYVSCINDYLTYTVDEKIIEDLFKQCTKCCCCSKHGHNRPTNYYTDEVSIGENIPEICNCICRHISRNIKRIQSTYSELKYYKKRKKCRRKSTFNIQFISSLYSAVKPQSIQNLHRHAQFDQVNLQSLP